MFATGKVRRWMWIVGLDRSPDQRPTLGEVLGRAGEFEVINIYYKQHLQAWMPKA